MLSTRVRSVLLGLALSCCAASVAAVQVVRFTPQGAMARIMQAEADFDAPAVALGDDGAADPYRIECDSDAARGAGRWVDPRHWVYAFEQPLAGAVSCRATPNPDFRDLQGRPLAGAAYAFTTGGPRAQVARPWGDEIAEDQVFVLSFNVAPDPQSVLDHAHCEVQGLGEAVPVRAITGERREQILQAIHYDTSEAAGVQLLQCKRLLPSGGQVRLVVGPGVRTPAAPGRAPVAGRTVLRQDFKVREAFRATLNCTRTNAQAPCSPLYPLTLSFSSPVPHALASQAVLQAPGGRALAPDLSEGGAPEGDVSSVRFAAPFPEKTTLRLTLPADLRDDMGRALSNGARFPLDVPIDALPPLVKFSSGPFGIVERFADGPPSQDRPALVPLALRRVGPQLRTRELALSAGQVADHVTTDDVQALQWFAKVQRLQEGRMTAGQFADVLASRPVREAGRHEPMIDVRSRSVFGARDPARNLALPGLPDAAGQDIEMIGVPLTAPGLHVLEVASPRLGAALLDARQGAFGGAMYVRSAVLVTNLAVHLKLGRDDALVWVTTLDGGKPVADAQVALLGCDGTRIRAGRTDGDGLWHSDGAVPADGWCEGTEQSGVFVTARIAADHPAAHGQADFSFAWSGWDQGIEPWRFDVPYSQSPRPDQVAHAVLDRTLLHAGETVSMKIFLRDLTRDGVRNPQTGCPADRQAQCLPPAADIVHVGSDETVRLPLHWQANPGGGLYALQDYPIPRTARLGRYLIQLVAPGQAGSDGDAGIYDGFAVPDAGSFRVEAFKLPMLTGSLKIAAPAPAGATETDATAGALPAEAAAGSLIAPAAVQADLQLAWQSGGPARDLQASLSAVAQPLTPAFADYSDYLFGVPDEMESGENRGASDGMRRLILDKQPVRLDDRGGARVELKDLPAVTQPQSWLFEASFADPNGEIQTLSQMARVWPSAVVVGLKTGRWMSRGETSAVQLLALDPQGHPRAGVPVRLDGRVRTTYSTRKRLVGGFYAYDTHEQVASLGTLCQGTTDAQGRLECPVTLDRDGEIQLFAQARDGQGRVSRAATSIWVWGGENWFAGGDDDRIDVIPSKASYRPGETAEFTVRMPFRRAQALVAVEREGVLETHVVELDGDQPVVRLPVKGEWGPNVYVSVLAVRGRIRHVPWSSFFDWGWRHPVEWARARADQADDAPAPTGLVDLAKPSFRFGLAQIRVSSDADRLTVRVEADRQTYQVRDTAQVTIQALLPDGKPAAGAGVAFAAVDEALLDLMDNASWDLLGAMRVPRDEGVRTATSQGQVVGRRHYGRKAVPAGGGGGFGATRELFDTLLLWRGDLTLDAQGRATVQVPLNDSLTRFRLVAVVDQEQGRFGTGSTDIVSTQDLQLVSGLPQVAREQDRYTARITVRNRTGQAMPLTVSAQVQGDGGAGQSLPEQTLDLAAGASRVLSWPVQAPELDSDQEQEVLRWTFAARPREGASASDRIVVTQTLLPAVPVTVRQATLLQIRPGAPLRVPVDASAQAQLDRSGVPRGGIRVSLQSSLAGTLPGVRDWLAAYPYACLEQLGAKAVGLRDDAAWQALMQRLPDYQDDSGLLAYFPGGRGSVALTAQMIEVSARAQVLGWPDALPDAARERMLSALQQYVFGRLDEDAWAPVEDRFWRKLIAIDALALAGAWQPGMLDSFALDVSDWPTPAVVTWLSVLQHVPALPDRAALLAQTDAVLRARLSRHGTSLVISDATADQGWWLMSNVATAQARLLMTVLSRPEWREDRSRLLAGLLSLQIQGAWSTTTANVLGVLAVNQYARQEETGAGQGAVTVALPPGAARTLDWADMPEAGGVRRQVLDLPWPASRQGTLQLAQQGPGSGWATVTARAAVPQTRAVDAGLRVERSIVPVARARPDRWSVGDIYRVRLRIHSREPVVWSVISDPVPAGASILGGGLGRDSTIATQGESADLPSWDRPAFVERDAGMYRAYFEVLDAGIQTLEYTVRINTPGTYQLPPTRIEALYQPDVFGSLPNEPLTVGAE